MGVLGIDGVGSYCAYPHGVEVRRPTSRGMQNAPSTDTPFRAKDTTRFNNCIPLGLARLAGGIIIDRRNP